MYQLQNQASNSRQSPHGTPAMNAKLERQIWDNVWRQILPRQTLEPLKILDLLRAHCLKLPKENISDPCIGTMSVKGNSLHKPVRCCHDTIQHPYHLLISWTQQMSQNKKIQNNKIQLAK